MRLQAAAPLLGAMLGLPVARIAGHKRTRSSFVVETHCAPVKCAAGDLRTLTCQQVHSAPAQFAAGYANCALPPRCSEPAQGLRRWPSARWPLCGGGRGPMYVAFRDSPFNVSGGIRRVLGYEPLPCAYEACAGRAQGRPSIQTYSRIFARSAVGYLGSATWLVC